MPRLVGSQGGGIRDHPKNRVGARALTGVLCLGALTLAACDDYSTGDRGGIDPTPERLDGSSSQEFEPDDIARAEAASEAVQEYCDGAVPEAQRVGCLSHVDESETP